MEEKTKANLKRIAGEAEVRIARSLLRWKYRKEGREFPFDHQIERDSRYIAGKAHEVISRRGKNIFNELKRVCKKNP